MDMQASLREILYRMVELNTTILLISLNMENFPDTDYQSSLKE